MILEKYQHIQTPKEILDYLNQMTNSEEQAYQSMDYLQYATEMNKPRNFLKDSLRYQNERGKKSNVIPFHTYFPTFETLDPYRKEFYFYWRSEAVKGNFLSTELSYIFLFIYELVNYGYSSDAAFNISMMEKLYLAYIYRYPKLGKYLPNWMADFLLEAGETRLASEWMSIETQDNLAYIELKLYDDSIKNLSMHTWWKYITERSRSPFLAKQKQKVYTHFKEATFFLHEFYKKENGEGIFEKMFPLQKTAISRQLYVSCLIERQVSFENLEVERRIFDPNYGLFLSDLMRVCENVARKNANEETLLRIRPERISNEIETLVVDYLEETERSTRFKKVSDGSTAEKGDSIPSPVEEAMDIQLDFERIETLKDESEAFQKLYEEKYGEEEEQEEERKEEGSHPKKEENLSFVVLSDAEDKDGEEAFLSCLSQTEKEFLLLYRIEPLTVEETKAFLKRKGILFGTFLIDLNEKATEYLGDILFEEDDDTLELTEELTIILSKL